MDRGVVCMCKGYIPRSQREYVQGKAAWVGGWLARDAACTVRPQARWPRRQSKEQEGKKYENTTLESRGSYRGYPPRCHVTRARKTQTPLMMRSTAMAPLPSGMRHAVPTPSHPIEPATHSPASLSPSRPPPPAPPHTPPATASNPQRSPPHTPSRSHTRLPPPQTTRPPPRTPAVPTPSRTPSQDPSPAPTASATPATADDSSDVRTSYPIS